jgi:hypothetical protein
LWETSDTKPTLIQLSTSGAVLWRRSVATIFGGPQYNPNYGWDFVSKHGLDIGTMDYAPTGKRMPLGNLRTVDIAQETGRLEWSVLGDYDCGGPLQFLASDVVCDYSGTALEASPTKTTFSGLRLTLKGLDVDAGRTTWALEVGNARALALGAEGLFLDGEDLAVESPGGKWLLLDVASSVTQAVAAHQVFWCEQLSYYSVTESQGSTNPGERAAQSVFTGCSADGQAVAGIPSTQPADVGGRVGQWFIWPTPHGIRAVPAS